MTEQHEVTVERTPLPGVGLRMDFITSGGRRVGVVQLQAGGVELFICQEADPDLAAASVDLTAGEAATLTELFGGSAFSHELSHLQAAASGIAVDWLAIEAGTRFEGRPLGETRLRTRTGVSIVAVVRDGTPIPAPAPSFVFQASDVAVAVGTVDGLTAAADIIRSE